MREVRAVEAKVVVEEEKRVAEVAAAAAGWAVVAAAAVVAVGGAAAVTAVARGEAAAVAAGLEASGRGVGEAGAAPAEKLGLEARRPPPEGGTRRARARVPHAGGPWPLRGEAPRAASTARLRAGRSSTPAALAYPRRQVLLGLLASRCRDRPAAGAFGTGRSE